LISEIRLPSPETPPLGRALTSDRSELTAPAGSEVTPALICESKELATPIGTPVTAGALISDGTRPDGRALRLSWESNELIAGAFVGRALTSDTKLLRPDTPAAPDGSAMICEITELTNPEGTPAGTLTPVGRTPKGKALI
jgi:hypothetical protein